MADDANVIKIVLIGDVSVGKTATAAAYSNAIVGTDVPVLVPNVVVDDTTYALTLCDTRGGEGEDVYRIRTLSYAGADVFIAMYSIDDASSLENIEQRWLPEITNFRPDTPFVLVGNKIDLRATDPDIVHVSEVSGGVVSERIGAAAHVECSALTKEGLAGVFETCVRVGSRGQSEKKGGGGGPCCVQ